VPSASSCGQSDGEAGSFWNTCAVRLSSISQEKRRKSEKRLTYAAIALCQLARHCTVPVCTALHCASLHDTAPLQFARHCTVPVGTALHCASWHCIAPCQFARHCTVAVRTALHCASWHGTALCQLARHCTVPVCTVSVFQRHCINAPYTGLGPQRDQCLHQSMHALKQSMSVTVPIFMKLAFTAQLFVKSCCTEFCENRTNVKSPILQHKQTDGRTDIVITRGVIFFTSRRNYKNEN